jgi:hypothetical protein
MKKFLAKKTTFERYYGFIFIAILVLIKLMIVLINIEVSIIIFLSILSIILLILQVLSIFNADCFMLIKEDSLLMRRYFHLTHLKFDEIKDVYAIKKKEIDKEFKTLLATDVYDKDILKDEVRLEFLQNKFFQFTTKLNGDHVVINLKNGLKMLITPINSENFISILKSKL